MTGTLILWEFGHRTRCIGRTPYDSRDQDTRDISANPGIPPNAKDCQKQREAKKARKDYSQESSEGKWPCLYLAFRLKLPELGHNRILMF